MTGATPPRVSAGLILILSALILVLIIDVCQGGPPAPRAKDNDSTSAVSAAVRAIFRQRCQRCHEADGTGSANDVPDFTDSKWQPSRTDSQLLVGILDGKGSGMPAFRGKVTDAEARELVALTRAFARNGNGARAAADFATKFRQLQEELAGLQKQYRDLKESTPAVKADR